MKYSTGINNAPWVISIGMACTTISLFVGGPMGLVLSQVGLVVVSASMGTLLTHHPG